MIRQRTRQIALALSFAFVLAFVATAVAQKRAPTPSKSVSTDATAARLTQLEQAVSALQAENAKLRSVLQVGSTDVTLVAPSSNGKVQLKGKDIRVEAAASADIKSGTQLKLQSNGNATLQGGPQTIIKGGLVKIN